MPDVVRKLNIFATADGLILQPAGGSDHNNPIRIDFKSKSIVPHVKVEPETFKQSPHLESHGVIGKHSRFLQHFAQVLNTRGVSIKGLLIYLYREREQVAQIFGRPIYGIRDIAVLPLSSQTEADQTITKIRAGLQKAKGLQASDLPSSPSEESGDESFDDHSVGDPSESRTPIDETLQGGGQNKSTTSVVQNVIQRKGYGQFASQWFSRRGWGLGNKRTGKVSTDQVPSTQPEDQKSLSAMAASVSQEEHAPLISEALQQEEDGDPVLAQQSSYGAATEMLPKILRTVKLLFTSQSFYFSYEFNITRRFGSSSITSLKTVSPEGFDQSYFWNRQLTFPFSKAGSHAFIMPIMQGFIGQQHFVVENTQNKTRTEAIEPESLGSVFKADGTRGPPRETELGLDRSPSFLLTLISRRSVKRSGLRYLRRGIDDEGNCANNVETEQILSSPSWEDPAKIRSFVQIRGSIPLYFSQLPYAFKPVPILQHSSEVNQKAFDRHFEELRRRYGSVHIVLLVDKQGGEKRIGGEYENFVKSSNQAEMSHELGFNWFDFHTECRGMKFENVQKLVEASEDTMRSFGETMMNGETLEQRQTGIIRTNCMDCLDRTNVVQSAFAQYMLQKDLATDGLKIDFVHDASTQWFNTLWADNGDAISRQYASTAALKGDYTRTRKRDYRGALNDFGLTLTRYYNNIVNDYFSQTVIDVLLGNVTPRVFDDFQATMMSTDPGISIHKVRENAIDTCSKIVIQHQEEDLIHGWAMLTPAHTNTLRTLPFEEAILLLTDHAIYGCKFDWNTEKVASFERVDLRFITKIRFGTYITSTLTEGQMNEDLNVGLVIAYSPSKDSIKRVNTRSLQVSADKEAKDRSEDNEDSVIFSWLRNRNAESSQCMAMKVIPNQSLADEMGNSSPLATAEHICTDIQRAVKNSVSHGEQCEIDLVEKADIISRADARSRTGYLEQIGYSIKKLVWT